jgi:hypothetical protein
MLALVILEVASMLALVILEVASMLALVILEVASNLEVRTRSVSDAWLHRLYV